MNHIQFFSITRLGKSDVEEQIRQSKANIHLEGLTPNPKTLPLIKAMAKGSLGSEAAIKEICSWYAH